MKRTLRAHRVMVSFGGEGRGRKEGRRTYTSKIVTAKHALACVQ